MEDMTFDGGFVPEYKLIVSKGSHGSLLLEAMTKGHSVLVRLKPEDAVEMAKEILVEFGN